MSATIGYITIGAIFGAIILLALQCTVSKKTDAASDIERRGVRGCRRRRHTTAIKTEQIATLYQTGAITLAQAIHRVREQEAPIDIARRVLKQNERTR